MRPIQIIEYTEVMSSENDVDLDEYLGDDTSVDELFKEQFDTERFSQTFDNVMSTFETAPPAEALDELPDERLIKGTGIASHDINVDDITLDGELTPEEQVVAAYGGDGETTGDVMADAISKATAEAQTERGISKREMMNLAAETIEDFVRESVREDGIDQSTVERLKFAARRAVAVEHEAQADSLDKDSFSSPGDEDDVSAADAEGGADPEATAADGEPEEVDETEKTSEPYEAVKSLATQQFDGRIYIDDPDEAPEGAEVRKGSQGELFYVEDEE